MKSRVDFQQYIIQIDLSDSVARKDELADRSSEQDLDLETVQRFLNETGVQLDENYGPILINPQQRRYVVRGQATTAARRRVERTMGSGVKFFSDGRIQPAVSADKT